MDNLFEKINQFWILEGVALWEEVTFSHDHDMCEAQGLFLEGRI